MSRGRFSTNPGFNPTDLARKDYELVAGQTGGIAAFYKLASQLLAALDRMTRAHYVIGYYPTRQVAADELREIAVSVRKPGFDWSIVRATSRPPPCAPTTTVPQ